MPSRGDGPPKKDADFVFCRNCKHYYVTWDKHFPHGCRALDFKCKTLPAAAVRASSGMPCLSFTRKEARPGGQKSKKKK